MAYRRRFIDTDPRQITAKYAGTCAGCGKPTAALEQVVYEPRRRRIYCMGDACGGQLLRDLAIEIFDQAVYDGQYGGR